MSMYLKQKETPFLSLSFSLAFSLYGTAPVIQLVSQKLKAHIPVAQRSALNFFFFDDAVLVEAATPTKGCKSS